jgi:hypothetical protein
MRHSLLPRIALLFQSPEHLVTAALLSHFGLQIPIEECQLTFVSIFAMLLQLEAMSFMRIGYVGKRFAMLLQLRIPVIPVAEPAGLLRHAG